MNGKLLTRLYSIPMQQGEFCWMIKAASTEVASSYNAQQHTDAGTQHIYMSEGNVESMTGNCLTAATVATNDC